MAAEVWNYERICGRPGSGQELGQELKRSRTTYNLTQRWNQEKLTPKSYERDVWFQG